MRWNLCVNVWKCLFLAKLECVLCMKEDQIDR